VWAADITYVPFKKEFWYLFAIMDWHTRKVLTWRLSDTMTADFCAAALHEALALYGTPEIFNTDSQNVEASYPGCRDPNTDRRAMMSGDQLPRVA
jgi:putative transposase